MLALSTILQRLLITPFYISTRTNSTKFTDILLFLLKTKDRAQAYTISKGFKNPRIVDELQKKMFTLAEEEDWWGLGQHIQINHSKILIDLDVIKFLKKRKSLFRFRLLTESLWNATYPSKYTEYIGYFDSESFNGYKEDGSRDPELAPYIVVSVVQITKKRIDDKWDTFTGEALFHEFLAMLIELIKQNSMKSLTMIAHNFSGHDGLLMIAAFADLHKQEEFRVSIIVNDNKLYMSTVSFKYCKIDYKLIFQCSVLLLKSSLADLSKIYGAEESKGFLPYYAIRSREDLKLGKDLLVNAVHPILEMPGCLNLGEPEPEIPTPEDWAELDLLWSEGDCDTVEEYCQMYCAKDVGILQDVFNTFIDIYKRETKITRVKYSSFITVSRLAMLTWYIMRGINDHSLIAIVPKRKIHEFIKEAYYGGKTEIYKGFLDFGTKCLYYDFPGMYAIAIGLKLPVGAPVWMKTPVKYNTKEFLQELHDRGLCGFFKVSFTTPDTDQPILPIKARARGSMATKLMFCVGSHWGTYYSHELILAIEHGYTIDLINHGFIFKSGYPLKKYSEYMTGKKEDAKKQENPSMVQFYKLLNNSLYGKFAINPVIQTYFGAWWEVKGPTRIHGFKQAIKGEDIWIIQKKVTESKSKRTNIALAAAVASWGRIILQTGIKNVLAANPTAKLIYVDTDSIFLQCDKDIVCDKLWEGIPWKTIKTYEHVRFLAPKIYMLQGRDNPDGVLKWTVRVKGVKRVRVNITDMAGLGVDKTDLFVRANQRWHKVDLRSVFVKLTDKVLKPFTAPKRETVWEYPDGQKMWGGLTKPFDFVRTTPYVKQHHTVQWKIANLHPEAPDVSAGVKPEMPNTVGCEWTYQTCTLTIIERRELGYFEEYIVRWSTDEVSLYDLFYAIYIVSQIGYLKLGVCIWFAPTGQYLTVGGDYVGIHEFLQIGAANFADHVNNSMTDLIERYNLSEKEVRAISTPGCDSFYTIRLVQ